VVRNGIEATLLVDGKKVGQRRVVLDRGSDLDNALNMFNTIEFLYDGNTVLFSTSNTALDEADAVMPRP